MLTSTRRIGAWPDHERPLSTVCRPAGSGASHSSSNADLTGWTERPGYHFVFQAVSTGASETSSRPSHLMLEIPIQPGTTSRSGKPWSAGSVRPFIS